MKISIEAIRPLLNRAYLARVALHPEHTDIYVFQQYLRAQAGIDVDLAVMSDHLGRTGYTVKSIDVQDERLYAWWVLQWS
jgi:hypothetical protein